MCDCESNIFNTIEVDNIGLETLINIGTGAEIVESQTVTNAYIRSITAGANVTVTQNAEDINIAAETKNLTNIGLGAQIVESQTADNAYIRTILAGANVTVTQNTDDIEISTTSVALTNIGTGEELVASSTPTNADIRTLVAGPNITLTTGLDTITIEGTVGAGLETLTNVGTGAQIATNPTTSNVDIRSITAGSGMVVSQSATEIELSTIAGFSTKPQTIFYQYMTPIQVNYSIFYTGAGIVTGVFNDIDPELEGTLTVISTTTFEFTPAPRRTAPVLVMLKLTSALTGEYTTLSIKMTPRLTWARDTSRDLLLGSGVDDVIYQIDNLSNTVTPMENYDFTPLSLGAVAAMAMDQLDNILFYTLTGTPTTVRYYDFVTKTSTIVENYNATSGWTSGAIISTMAFDQRNCVLYLLGDTAGAVVRLLHITPFDRAVGLKSGISPSYASPMINVAGNIQHSLCVDSDSKALFGVVKPAAADVQLRTLNFPGATPTSLYTLTLTGNSSAHCEIAASGLLYCIDDTSLQMRKTLPSRNTNNTALTFVSAVAFRDLTVSPYGILV